MWNSLVMFALTPSHRFALSGGPSQCQFTLASLKPVRPCDHQNFPNCDKFVFQLHHQLGEAIPQKRAVSFNGCTTYTYLTIVQMCSILSAWNL